VVVQPGIDVEVGQYLVPGREIIDALLEQRVVAGFEILRDLLDDPGFLLAANGCMSNSAVMR
jgi:hypothetical protein